MNQSESKFKLLDVEGNQTGVKFGTKTILSFIIPIIIYFLLSMLPLQAYGELTAKGLAFVAAMIVFMIMSPLDPAIGGMLLITIGPLLGVCTWADVKAACGSSSFYPMLGMTIVALGCEFTPFGKRVAYWFLYKFGQKPVAMLIAVGVVSALLSAFVSNTAVIVLLSAIVNTMLLTMGEKPGESRLGKAAMLIVLMGAEYGGMALINGSPGSNNLCIGTMMSAAEGYDISLTYTQWARVGFPIFLLTIVPMCLIYIFYFKIRKKDFTMLPKSYYKQKSEELGKMSGAEWRWVIITVAMIVSMLLGMDSNLAAMLFAAISLLPVIGVNPFKECLSKVPWAVLIGICTLPIIGTILQSTGVSAWIQDAVAPLLSGLSPLGLSVALALVMFLLVNILVNAFVGVWVSMVSLGTILSISMGYNPVVVVFPCLLTASFMWCMGTNAVSLLNKGYDWWDMKDPIIPGFISGIIASILIPLMSYGLNLLYGVSPLL